MAVTLVRPWQRRLADVIGPGVPTDRTWMHDRAEAARTVDAWLESPATFNACRRLALSQGQAWSPERLHELRGAREDLPLRPPEHYRGRSPARGSAATLHALQYVNASVSTQE
jgi:hypothetical protein